MLVASAKTIRMVSPADTFESMCNPSALRELLASTAEMAGPMPYTNTFAVALAQWTTDSPLRGRSHTSYSKESYPLKLALGLYTRIG